MRMPTQADLPRRKAEVLFLLRRKSTASFSSLSVTATKQTTQRGSLSRDLLAFALFASVSCNVVGCDRSPDDLEIENDSSNFIDLDSTTSI